MKLRQLSRLLLLTSLIGAVLLAAAGALLWQRTSSDLERIGRIGQVHERGARLRVALEHAERTRRFPELAGVLATESLAMAAALDGIELSRRRVAQQYFEEIAVVMQGLPSRVGLDAPLAPREIDQLRLYANSADTALEQMLHREREQVVSMLLRSLSLFLAATIVFALIVGAGFYGVHRRIAGPSREIEAGLARLVEGDLDTRIPAEAEDELSDIARSINAMAEQLHAQQRAKERVERRFREIARISAGAIWEIDTTTGEGWWVDADGSLVDTGVEGKPTSLDELLDLVAPEDREILRDMITGTEASADSWRLAYRMRRPDGSLAQVESQAMRLRDEETGRVLVIGGTRDVTGQREMEEQLRQSQRLESIGQLTGGVSHDFNNLLTVILGNTEMLQQSLRDRPPELELLAMIQSAAERGADLNRRLLAFARRQPLDPRVVDINELLRGLEPMLRRTLGEQLELGLRTGSDLWPSMLDPSQLEAAILNLAINARDAIGEHGSLEIATANVSLEASYTDHFVDLLPGDYVRIDISDDGPGIPRELLEHVFEPFFTTKPTGQGTGLGLSMVYGFVKQSGGHARIYSEPDMGTTVHLYLPRAECADEPARTGTTEPTEVEQGDETILLVEDDDMVRTNGSRILSGLGYRILEAEDGPGALSLLERHPEIDLLFTDVVMPGGMTGRDLVEAARDRRPGLPVLYTSGYNESAIVHQGRLDAGIHFLQKPYIRRQLAARVREALDGGTGEASPGETD